MVTFFWYWGKKKKIREGVEDAGAAPAQRSEHSMNTTRTALFRADQLGERLETDREVMEGRREVKKVL